MEKLEAGEIVEKYQANAITVRKLQKVLLKHRDFHKNPENFQEFSKRFTIARKIGFMNLRNFLERVENLILPMNLENENHLRE